MKKFVLSVMTIFCALTVYAQGTEMQMATLQHGNETKVFYGVDAFISAYNEAADTLDVITLSGGDFNVPSQISKSIAIYGNGMEPGIAPGGRHTYLMGDIVLKPADTVNEDEESVKGGKRVNGIHIEGLQISGEINVANNDNIPIHNLEVVKCYLWRVVFYVDNYDCVFRQTHTYSGFSSGFIPYSKDFSYAENLLISNCYIGDCNTWHNASSDTHYGFSTFDNYSTILIDHCILCKPTGTSNSGRYGSFRYTNNIFYSNYFDPGAVLSGNIFVATPGNPSEDQFGNWTGIANAGLWAAEDEDGSYADDKTFELKYPDRYIGTDGTQIGLHGGKYAWNKIPSIPRITECTINTDEATQGKLKVSIKAEAQTKE